MRSTVALNSGRTWALWGAVNGVKPSVDRGKELLRSLAPGVSGGDLERKSELDIGVALPVVGELAVDPFGRESASDAARRRRLVVPKAFVEPDRAEQTTATLLPSM